MASDEAGSGAKAQMGIKGEVRREIEKPH
jgi:hypothetical protein